MLRDHIVCGINDTIIQLRLLSEKELSFKTALELAQGMESAAENVSELNVPACDLPSSTGPSITAGQNPVNQVGDNAAGRPYRCGKPGHYASTCKHKETVCNKCGKVGDLQKVCRSKQSRPTRKLQKNVNKVQDDATDENITSPGKATPWNVAVDIEGITVSIQLDTGASKSLMSESILF